MQITYKGQNTNLERESGGNHCPKTELSLRPETRRNETYTRGSWDTQLHRGPEHKSPEKALDNTATCREECASSGVRVAVCRKMLRIPGRRIGRCCEFLEDVSEDVHFVWKNLADVKTSKEN